MPASQTLALAVSEALPTPGQAGMGAFQHAQIRWEDKLLRRLPQRWKRDALKRHRLTAMHQGLATANIALLDLADRFNRCRITPGATDAEVIEIAEKQARRARERLHLCHAQGMSADSIRRNLEKLCDEWKVTPPPGRMADASAIARMTDGHWWRRKLRKEQGREREALAIFLGYVHSKGDLYISAESFERELGKQRRNRAILEETEAISEDGEIFTLAELSDASVSNPSIRRAELMTRLRGMEEIALECGHVGKFVTITCPSRMHAKLHVSGENNPSYDGTTPKQAQEYLCGLWARIRAKLAREGIGIYGFRIAEPHHDGTPHWHLPLFVAPHRASGLEEIIRRYALEDSPDEPGARERRCKFIDIDRSKGSAAAYVAKYVSKNIDGFGMDADLEGNPAAESAQRVQAWAKQHGVRQFQQIGGAPVTLWRELRRIPPEVVKDAPEAIVKAWEAAQRREGKPADFGAFLKAIGGPLVKRKDQAIQLVQDWADRVGRYGREASARPLGVVLKDAPRVIYKSVRKAWQVVARPGRLSGATNVVAGPWTRVNNCTRRETARTSKGWFGGAPPNEKGGYASEPSPITA